MNDCRKDELSNGEQNKNKQAYTGVETVAQLLVKAMSVGPLGAGHFAGS